MAAKFAHRHYATIAHLLSRHFAPARAAGMNESALIDAFADMFARDNGSFSRSRFLAAARGEPSGRDKATAPGLRSPRD